MGTELERMRGRGRGRKKKVDVEVLKKVEASLLDFEARE